MSLSVFDLFCYMDNKLCLAAHNGDSAYLNQAFSQPSADFGLVASSDNRGWNALHEAAAAGNHTCLEIILQFLTDKDDLEEKNKLLNCKTFIGYTPLVLAVTHDHLACVQLLLEHGSSVNETLNDNSTALHFTCSASVCSVLLDAGAEINQKSDFDVTPLLNCLSRNDDEYFLNSAEIFKITQVLIDRGADAFCTTSGCDSAVMATLFCCSSLVYYLLSYEKEKRGAASVAEHINRPLSLVYQPTQTTMLSCAVLRACDCTTFTQKEDALKSLNLLFEFGGIFKDVQCACVIQPRVWLLLLLWDAEHTDDVFSASMSNDFCVTLDSYLRQEAGRDDYEEDDFAQLLGLVSAGSSAGASISSWMKFESVRQLINEDYIKDSRKNCKIAASWLKKRLCQPRSLQHLSRLKLRQSFVRSGLARGNAELSELCRRLQLSQPATDLVLLSDASEALRKHQPDLHVW